MTSGDFVSIHHNIYRLPYINSYCFKWLVIESILYIRHNHTLHHPLKKYSSSCCSTCYIRMYDMIISLRTRRYKIREKVYSVLRVYRTRTTYGMECVVQFVYNYIFLVFLTATECAPAIKTYYTLMCSTTVYTRASNIHNNITYTPSLH